ncbi:hypothetical protein [Rufibacter roseus]
MLLKIAVLATAYATLTFLILYLLSKATSIKLFQKWRTKKFYTWLPIGFTYSIGLLIFSFTYWGNHGLGDSSRIPVGHGQAIYNSDGAFTYLYPDKKKTSYQLQFLTFTVSQNKLSAEKEDGRYVVFDLKTSELKEFESQATYNQYALSNSLPGSNEFKDFISHYHDYWKGWRFYLLP